MERLKLSQVGPMSNIDVRFGDITVLVGPQAVGKSLFLQYLNLLLNYPAIRKTLEVQGFVIKNTNDTLGHYLGIEMAKSWKTDSKIAVDGKSYEIEKLTRSKPREFDNSVFYIPAQRVLIMEDGWPRSFMSLSSYPYVVRDFSENLRILLEGGIIGDDTLFPQEGRFKRAIAERLQRGIFRNATIKMEKEFKKRVVLEVAGDNHMQLPLSCWSSGQREFMPFLLGLLYLIPPSKTTRKAKIQTVIIEELEMGLHPEAINGVMLAIMELLNRDYRVIISTHSIHVVEMIWALSEIKKSHASPADKLKAFGKLFNVDSSLLDVRKIQNSIMGKEYSVYYFKPGSESGLTESVNISALDPGEDDLSIAGWGGLTEFSSNIVDIVSGIHNSENED